MQVKNTIYSSFDDDPAFRPDYSTSIKGTVTPDLPLLVQIETRDPLLACMVIHLSGPDNTDFSMTRGRGVDHKKIRN